MTVEIPWDRLVEEKHNWDLAGNTMGAGMSFNGASVDVRSDGGGLWVVTLKSIQFIDRLDTLLWRALRRIAVGGVVPLVVYRRDTTWAPFPGSGENDPITFSDDTLFDDGTGFYQPVIDVQAAEDAALRATSMVLDLIYCGEIQGGESFSIQHDVYDWRIYEIGTATVNDDETVTVTFEPPLREAVTAGTQIEFDRPRCTVKLQNSSAMDLENSTYPFSLASVTLIESKYPT